MDDPTQQPARPTMPNVSKFLTKKKLSAEESERFDKWWPCMKEQYGNYRDYTLVNAEFARRLKKEGRFMRRKIDKEGYKVDLIAFGAALEEFNKTL